VEGVSKAKFLKENLTKLELSEGLGRVGRGRDSNQKTLSWRSMDIF